MTQHISHYTEWISNCISMGALDVSWTAIKTAMADHMPDDKWAVQNAYNVRKAELEK